MLATLIPTIFMLALGIILVAMGTQTEAIVIGVLVMAFCTSSLTGYILGSIFVARGALVARFQNDFLSAVSHELRTPLTSIRLFIETLRDERLTDAEEKDKCLTLLDREIHRLDGLVERLISLSRIETGRHEFERKPVLIKRVIDEALSSLKAASLSDPVTLDVAIEDDLYVSGDQSALSQALGNVRARMRIRRRRKRTRKRGRTRRRRMRRRRTRRSRPRWRTSTRASQRVPRLPGCLAAPLSA
jgi:two-component system phosphate regulon sensor histidine kinase PhoR